MLGKLCELLKGNSNKNCLITKPLITMQAQAWSRGWKWNTAHTFLKYDPLDFSNNVTKSIGRSGKQIALFYEAI